MVCAPLQRDKLRDYRLYRHTNHDLSHLYDNNQCRPCTFRVSCVKDWVSGDCGPIGVMVSAAKKYVSTTFCFVQADESICYLQVPLPIGILPRCIGNFCLH